MIIGYSYNVIHYAKLKIYPFEYYFKFENNCTSYCPSDCEAGGWYHGGYDHGDPDGIRANIMLECAGNHDITVLEVEC